MSISVLDTRAVDTRAVDEEQLPCRREDPEPVSYTHLTLPTIYSV